MRGLPLGLKLKKKRALNAVLFNVRLARAMGGGGAEEVESGQINVEEHKASLKVSAHHRVSRQCALNGELSIAFRRAVAPTQDLHLSHCHTSGPGIARSGSDTAYTPKAVLTRDKEFNRE